MEEKYLYKKRNKLTYRIELKAVKDNNKNRLFEIKVIQNSSHNNEVLDVSNEERFKMFNNEILFFENIPISMTEISSIILKSLTDHLKNKISPEKLKTITSTVIWAD